MELENFNPNGDNVVTSNLININIFFGENCEISVKIQKSYVNSFLEDAMIAQKTKFLIFFTSRSIFNELKLPL